MVPEELKKASLGRLFLLCFFFLVASFVFGVIGFTQGTWDTIVHLSQAALFVIMPSNKEEGKESKSFFHFFHKRSKSKSTEDERDTRQEPQRSTGQYDEVTSDGAEGKDERGTDETHGVFIVTTSPQPHSETKNTSTHALQEQGESDPVSLAFPEGTSGDDRDSEEEIIFLRDRVRELSESLLEAQQKLAVTRKALLLKTEQYGRLLFSPSFLFFVGHASPSQT